MDIYEAKRQHVLNEIKKIEGSFPKKEDSLTPEQLKKIEHHAEKFGHKVEEVVESILRDPVAFRSIVGKDPSRMDYYETALVEYLVKQPQVERVQKLPKGGKNSYHIDKGRVVQGKKTKLMKKIVMSSVEKIYIALDKDAQKQALDFCEKLMQEGKEVYLVDMQDKDPSEMGFNNFTKLIQETYPLTFSGLLEKKLFL